MLAGSSALGTRFLQQPSLASISLHSPRASRRCLKSWLLGELGVAELAVPRPEFQLAVPTPAEVEPAGSAVPRLAVSAAAVAVVPTEAVPTPAAQLHAVPTLPVSKSAADQLPKSVAPKSVELELAAPKLVEVEVNPAAPRAKAVELELAAPKLVEVEMEPAAPKSVEMAPAAPKLVEVAPQPFERGGYRQGRPMPESAEEEPAARWSLLCPSLMSLMRPSSSYARRCL